MMSVFVLVLSASCLGYTFDQVAVEQWAGSGANEAMCVIDFGGGNNYAFGYRWDGPATSEDMLVDLDAQTNLTIDYSYHPTYGFGLDGISYQGHSIVVSPFWDPYYPAFWWSGHAAYDEDLYDDNWNYIGTVTHPAAAGDGENWLYAPLGASSRELADGVWDGWTQGENWVADPPATPTPEPMTAAMMAVAAAFFVRRRINR